ncbi:MAG: AraC family transcriptional regulator [Pseudanabaenales cyanobacterium]|nr:AraC family transcriptional regulator [Pseudanabaenales cyanobacterium]
MDIALDCGFNSHSHLSKQFRKLTGITPKAYRAS